MTKCFIEERQRDLEKCFHLLDLGERGEPWRWAWGAEGRAWSWASEGFRQLKDLCSVVERPLPLGSSEALRWVGGT